MITESTLEQIRQEIKTYKDRLAETEAVVAELTAAKLDLPGGGLVVTIQPRFTCSTLAEVVAIRKWLRKHMGFAKFAIRQRWSVGSSALTAWKSPDCYVEIWLLCPVAEYPAELMGERCRWVPVTDQGAEPDYTFACEPAPTVPPGDA